MDRHLANEISLHEAQAWAWIFHVFDFSPTTFSLLLRRLIVRFARLKFKKSQLALFRAQNDFFWSLDTKQKVHLKQLLKPLDQQTRNSARLKWIGQLNEATKATANERKSRIYFADWTKWDPFSNWS